MTNPELQEHRVDMQAETSDEKPPGKKPPEYITVGRLRSERCWTPSMIRDYLGPEDRRARNPHYRTAPPMRLYLIKRVLAAEANFDMVKVREARARRSEAAKRGWEPRMEKRRAEREQTRTTVESCDLGCRFTQTLEKVRLIGQARYEEIRAYYDAEYGAYVERSRRLGRVPERRSSNTGQHPGVPDNDRHAINYLRHERTDYDYLLNKFQPYYARPVLRERIHAAIGEAYPELRKSAEAML